MSAENFKLTYEERAELAVNHAAKRLFLLMAEKKTNLTLNNDVTDSKRFLELADEIGPHIAVLKTHIDVIEDFTPDFIKKILDLAKKHNFMIFEDRKFSDIGNTVRLQYSKGIYRIAEWANMVNAHIISGPGIVEGIRTVMNKMNDNLERGILILAQMSSEGTLATAEYTKRAVEIANQYKQDVAGYIGSGSNGEELRKLAELSFVGHAILTPGIELNVKGDGLGQAYATPEQAVFSGSDVMLVGRGIYERAEDPLEAAKAYREAGWAAYEKRIQ